MIKSVGVLEDRVPSVAESGTPEECYYLTQAIINLSHYNNTKRIIGNRNIVREDLSRILSQIQGVKFTTQGDTVSLSKADFAILDGIAAQIQELVKEVV